jgi:hypothetical protein
MSLETKLAIAEAAVRLLNLSQESTSDMLKNIAESEGVDPRFLKLPDPKPLEPIMSLRGLLDMHGLSVDEMEFDQHLIKMGFIAEKLSTWPGTKSYAVYELDGEGLNFGVNAPCTFSGFTNRYYFPEEFPKLLELVEGYIDEKLV